MTVPILWIAADVRPHHANTFAEEWLRESWTSGAMWDAFAETGLLKWPSSTGDDTADTPEGKRYRDIEDEILHRMLDTLRPAILAAFTNAATEVLTRERAAQRQ